jgi:Zn-dependent protease with chaperone function
MTASDGGVHERGSFEPARRRLLADATAVQFTRDPTALARAYLALTRWPTALDLGLRWPGELFLLDAKTASNMSPGSPYPSLTRRIERLNAMGAHVASPRS